MRRPTFSNGLIALSLLLTLGVALVEPAHAGAVRPGFNASTFLPNDDGTYPANGLDAGTPPGSPVAQPLGFLVNFFGLTFTSAFINNNGNITFDSALSTFTPFNLTTTGRQIIAPFFADVDTRFAGSPVTLGLGTVDGHNAFGVNWVNVDYFASETTHTNRNSFQLVLIERSDTGPGNFDIEFNYDAIQWETGTASGGDASGLGGNSARAGFSNGTGVAGTFFELTGSAVNGALLDGTLATGLVHHSLNSDQLGRYDFFARNGIISTDSVPEPGSILLLGAGVAGLGGFGWRRHRRDQRAIRSVARRPCSLSATPSS